MFNDDSVNRVNVMIGEPKKALINMSIPLIISLLIISLYNLIDAMWISGLGADALAGIGFITPIFMVLMGIGNGLSAGSASAISKYIGESNKKKADNASVHAIIITIFISLLTTVILYLSLKKILLIMGAGQTIDFAMDYGEIIVLGSILIILYNSIFGVFRGEGDSSRPMYAMILSAILNIVLDPIFIYDLNFGVKGAAIATLISAFIVNIFLFYLFYIKRDTYLKPYFRNFSFDKDISLDIIKVGIPASLQLINNAFFAAVFSALLTFISGTDSVAVYSTGWRVCTIGTTPILAIGTALISIIAANYGMHNFKNIQIAHRYSMKISIVVSIFIMILTVVFAPQLASIFSYSPDSARLSGELTGFLSWIVIFYPTMAVGVSSTYVFQGVGRGITAMFQTIMRETGFTLFFAVLLGVVLDLGVWGAWMGIVLGEIVSNNITLIWADLYIKKLISNNV